MQRKPSSFFVGHLGISPGRVSGSRIALRRVFGLALLVGATVGCDEKRGATRPAPEHATNDALTAPPSGKSADSTTSREQLVAERPVEFHEPPHPGPHPFLLLLHGLGGEGSPLVSLLGGAFDGVVAAPDGLMDSQGRRFWNATDACCDFDARRPDDMAYLRAVIETAVRQHEVDPKRVYLIGYSNGGFMAHRLACELKDGVAGIVSIAGASPRHLKCKGSTPRVLQIHGSQDTTVPYSGGAGRVVGEQPGALGTVQGWADLAGCKEPHSERRDLLPVVPGKETHVLSFAGCRGGPVELWTLAGVGHQIPQLDALRPHLLEFLK